MEDLSVLEATLEICHDAFDDETDEDETISKGNIVGILLMARQNGLDTKSYPVFSGDNVIGQSEKCDICIPSKSMSKEHACITVMSGTHLIYDKGSRNRTKREKMLLCPEVRYELIHGGRLTFGDVLCTYMYHKQGSVVSAEDVLQSNNLASGWIGDISTTRSGLGVLLCPKSDDDDDSASDASSNILLSSQSTRSYVVPFDHSIGPTKPGSDNRAYVSTISETPEFLKKSHDVSSTFELQDSTLSLGKLSKGEHCVNPQMLLFNDEADDMLERHPAQLDALTRAIVETGEENGECTYIFYDDDDNVSEECDVDREAATQLLAGNLSEDTQCENLHEFEEDEGRTVVAGSQLCVEAHCSNICQSPRSSDIGDEDSVVNCHTKVSHDIQVETLSSLEAENVSHSEHKFNHAPIEHAQKRAVSPTVSPSAAVQRDPCRQLDGTMETDLVVGRMPGDRMESQKLCDCKNEINSTFLDGELRQAVSDHSSPTRVNDGDITDHCHEVMNGDDDGVHYPVLDGDIPASGLDAVSGILSERIEVNECDVGNHVFCESQDTMEAAGHSPCTNVFGDALPTAHTCSGFTGTTCSAKCDANQVQLSICATVAGSSLPQGLSVIAAPGVGDSDFTLGTAIHPHAVRETSPVPDEEDTSSGEMAVHIETAVSDVGDRGGGSVTNNTVPSSEILPNNSTDSSRHVDRSTLTLAITEHAFGNGLHRLDEMSGSVDTVLTQVLELDDKISDEDISDCVSKIVESVSQKEENGSSQLLPLINQVEDVILAHVYNQSSDLMPKTNKNSQTHLELGFPQPSLPQPDISEIKSNLAGSATPCPVCVTITSTSSSTLFGKDVCLVQSKTDDADTCQNHGHAHHLPISPACRRRRRVRKPKRFDAFDTSTVIQSDHGRDAFNFGKRCDGKSLQSVKRGSRERANGSVQCWLTGEDGGMNCAILPRDSPAYNNHTTGSPSDDCCQVVLPTVGRRPSGVDVGVDSSLAEKTSGPSSRLVDGDALCGRSFVAEDNLTTWTVVHGAPVGVSVDHTKEVSDSIELTAVSNSDGIRSRGNGSILSDTRCTLMDRSVCKPPVTQVSAPVCVSVCKTLMDRSVCKPPVTLVSAPVCMSVCKTVCAPAVALASSVGLRSKRKTRTRKCNGNEKPDKTVDKPIPACGNELAVNGRSVSVTHVANFASSFSTNIDGCHRLQEDIDFTSSGRVLSDNECCDFQPLEHGHCSSQEAAVSSSTVISCLSEDQPISSVQTEKHLLNREGNESLSPQHGHCHTPGDGERVFATDVVHNRSDTDINGAPSLKCLSLLRKRKRKVISSQHAGSIDTQVCADCSPVRCDSNIFVVDKACDRGIRPSSKSNRITREKSSVLTDKDLVAECCKETAKKRAKLLGGDSGEHFQVINRSSLHSNTHMPPPRCTRRSRFSPHSGSTDGLSDLTSVSDIRYERQAGAVEPGDGNPGLLAIPDIGCSDGQKTRKGPMISVSTLSGQITTTASSEIDFPKRECHNSRKSSVRQSERPVSDHLSGDATAKNAGRRSSRFLRSQYTGTTLSSTTANDSRLDVCAMKREALSVNVCSLTEDLSQEVTEKRRVIKVDSVMSARTSEVKDDQQQKSKLHSSVKTRHTPLVTEVSLHHSSPVIKPRVLFTGVVDKRGEEIVSEFGAEMAGSIHECTHLVTDKVRRTVKFLCGMALGVMIVTPQWLECCKTSRSVVDGHRFIVHDLAMERQYRFNLQGSLQKALHCPMLQGYAIHVTKSVLPGPQQMAGMLEITCAFFSPAFYLSAGILSLFTGDDFMQQYLTKMLNEFCK